MSDAVYTPKPGSIPWKVIKFLIENPDEELTRGDVAVKFDTFGGGVDTNLQLAVARGVLKKGRNSGMELVWMLGTVKNVDMGDLSEVAEEPPKLAPVLASMPWKPKPEPKPERVVIVIDPLTIPLEDGVPVSVRRGTAPGEDWMLLLARMKPTQCATLPIIKKHSVLKTIAKAHREKQGRWTSTVLPGKEQFRVWRTE